MHRPHAAVEREFADGAERLDLLRLDLPRGHEDAERDGQVERAALLAKVGGCERDDEPAERPGVAEVRERAFDAVDRFLDGEFRQADEDDLAHAAGEIDFDLDGQGVDPEQREGVELREHGRIVVAAARRTLHKICS